MLSLLTLAPSWVLFSPVNIEDPYWSAEVESKSKWSSPASFDLSQSVVRWDLPPTSYTDVGLGSGISWALAPDFCEWLLPRFPEEPFGRNSSIAIEFVSCSELRDAVNRAFGTWAANHKKISFTDVTDECARHIAETGAAECDWVEVYLKPDLSGYAEENGLAAYVQHRMEYARAGAAHSTAGAALADAIVVLNTTMHVRATDSFCWYLDTTFCYNIHRWEEVKDLDVVTMMRAFFAMLVVVSSIIVIAVLVRIFAAACSCSAGRHRTASVEADARAAAPNACVYHLCGGPRCEAVLAYLAKMPVGVLLCCLFFLMFAPVFYYKVFLPCWCAASEPHTAPPAIPHPTPSFAQGLLRLRGDDRPRGRPRVRLPPPRPVPRRQPPRRPRRRRRGAATDGQCVVLGAAPAG